MSKQNSPKQVIAGAPLPARWKGGDTLDSVYRFNERAIGLLSDAASKSKHAKYRELWSGLDRETIRRAAQLPFVVLDAHFADDTWWYQVTELKCASAASTSPHWPGVVAEPLMQEMMILAWHSVKSDRHAARLSLGMSPGVTRVIADLSPQQLTQISHAHSRELRLRWQDKPDFWSKLLRASRNGNQTDLEEIHLHAKLLLCGELI